MEVVECLYFFINERNGLPLCPNKFILIDGMNNGLIKVRSMVIIKNSGLGENTQIPTRYLGGKYVYLKQFIFRDISELNIQERIFAL